MTKPRVIWDGELVRPRQVARGRFALMGPVFAVEAGQVQKKEKLKPPRYPAWSSLATWAAITHISCRLTSPRTAAR